MTIARTNILGVGVSAITMAQALTEICQRIDTRSPAYISTCTVHTVMECHRNERVRKAVNAAALTTPDGMPLVWLSRCYSQSPVERVYGPDLMLALCALSLTRGYSHYFYGGESGIPQLLAERLQTRFPGLRVAGTASPPFHLLSPTEQKEITDQMNQAAPDIVWIGLGSPKQDLWMAAQRPYLTAPVLIGVGAAFNIHSGKLAQAPVWMRRSGLEWLFRLSQEPGRLWYRYLVYNPWFVLLITRQILGWRNYPLDMVEFAGD